MRHYELVILVNANQQEQVNSFIERYRNLMSKDGGIIHRFENWGRRTLAYPIKKIRKANYLLFNIECTKSTLEELEHSLRYSEGVLRYLVLSMKKAVTEPSPMMLGSSATNVAEVSNEANIEK